MKVIESKSRGKVLYVQVTEEPEILESQLSSKEGFASAQEIADRLEDISSTVKSVCETIYEKAFLALEDKKPAEFEIEFGIKLAGKAGIPLLTEGSAECAVKVSAKWV